MSRVPQRELDGIRAADAALLRTLERIDDDVARRPSRLPDWTVGHVLTHIARNADSVVRRLVGSAAGEVVDQYVGGPEGRAAEIEAGAGRSAAELVADVRRTDELVQQAIEAMPEDAWDRMSRTVGGQLRTAAQVVYSRWREVEVHHVDLGLGYAPTEWPEDLARRWLGELLPGLPDRSSPQELLAWCLQRGAAPQLADWE
jgi:maleylpyruvate isomerase